MRPGSVLGSGGCAWVLVGLSLGLGVNRDAGAAEAGAARPRSPTATAPARTTTRPAAAQNPYAATIRPLLNTYCSGCHNDNRQSGQLSLATPDSIREGGKSGPAIVPGQPGESELVRRLRVEGRGHMPPGNKPQPTQAQIAAIEKWIADGAAFGPASPAKEPADPAQTGAGGPKKAIEEPKEPPPPADEGAVSALKSHAAQVTPAALKSTLLRVNFLAAARKTNDADAIRLLEPVLIQLETLNLAGCSVGDESVAILARALHLRRLDLRATQVTDAGIESLAQLPALRELTLTQARLTDAVVKHLAAMPALERVTVTRSGISPRAVSELQAKRPKLRIDTGEPRGVSSQPAPAATKSP